MFRNLINTVKWSTVFFTVLFGVSAFSGTCGDLKKTESGFDDNEAEATAANLLSRQSELGGGRQSLIGKTYRSGEIVLINGE